MTKRILLILALAIAAVALARYGAVYYSGGTGTATADENPMSKAVIPATQVAATAPSKPQTKVTPPPRTTRKLNSVRFVAFDNNLFVATARGVYQKRGRDYRLLFATHDDITGLRARGGGLAATTGATLYLFRQGAVQKKTFASRISEFAIVGDHVAVLLESALVASSDGGKTWHMRDDHTGNFHNQVIFQGRTLWHVSANEAGCGGGSQQRMRYFTNGKSKLGSWGIDNPGGWILSQRGEVYFSGEDCAPNHHSALCYMRGNGKLSLVSNIKSINLAALPLQNSRGRRVAFASDQKIHLVRSGKQLRSWIAPTNLTSLAIGKQALWLVADGKLSKRKL